jgi:Bacterial Ig domain/Lipoprotein associated domain
VYQRTRRRLLKLRSKFTLLLLVGSLLLAAPAMALMTDMGRNIPDMGRNILPNILPAPTSQSDKANIDAPGGNPDGNPSGNSSPAIQGGRSDLAEPSASTLPSQKIQSDKDDYATGARVTLTGSYWQPGEYVRIVVNDDQGKTWSRNVDVRADGSGRIEYHFQLPEWFVATYEVTAMGEHSGVATTSFTESNVSFGSASSAAPAGRSVNYRRTHGAENTTTENSSCATGGTDACLPGDASGTNDNITDLIARFDSAKEAPVAQPQPIVSTDEDTPRTITLSATDGDGDNLSFFIVTPPSHGTLGPIEALTCAGTAPRTCSANVTYTPDENYNGFDIFSFKANDGTSESNPAPVSLLVNPVNDVPVSTDETKTMSEDGRPLSIDFGALLSDGETSDGDLAYDITDPPDPAKGSLGGSGPTRTFTPAANFNGTVDIGYTLADRGDPDKCSAANPPCAAAKISAQKTVSVTVDAVNDAPSFTEGPDQSTDEDSGAQTVEGWASAISGGPNESGQTVDFEVTNDNSGLFAAGEDPSVAPDGTLSYTPAADKNGSATVTIKAKDSGTTANGGQDESAQQTFQIALNAVNDAPSFTKGANETVNEDAGAQSVPNWATDISAGPADESGQQLTFQLTNDNNNLFTSGGEPSVSPDGTLSYTPADNANGTATVSVKLHDDGDTANGEVNQSAEQSFTITVGAVNDAPAAHADTGMIDEDTKQVIPSSDLVANDDEGADNESSQTLSVRKVYEGTNGTVSLGNSGNIVFTPESNFSGDATFRYLVCDNGSPRECSVQREPVDLTVSAVNDAPVADNQSVTTDEDTAREVTLSASDVEGDALGYTILSATQHGTLSGRGANLTYTPADDYRGPDSFTFKANDGTADSDPATVSISVNAVNDAPVASEDTKWSSEDTPLVFAARQLLGNDDPGPANESGQTLTVTAVDQAVNGQVSLDTNGDITFTPDADFNGQASFEYTVCDNGSPSECSETIAIMNVRGSPVNDAPSFTAGANQTVAEDSGPHSIPGWASGISAGHAEEYAQTLNFSVTNDNNSLFTPTGQPKISPSGTLSYTLTPEANGSATVRVTLTDDGGTANGGVDTSASQAFAITVGAVNDNPVISALSNSGPVAEGSPATITVNVTDADNPSGDLRYSFDCDNNNAFETGSKNANSSKCTFNDNGIHPVNVRVTDGPPGGSATNFTNVVVNNVAPTITGITASPRQALIGQPISFTGTATDPSSADTTAGFSWQWSKDGGAYVAGSNPFSTSFSVCGSHSVSAKATDKAGGTSAAATTATSVEVYNGTFLEPLKSGTDNLVQKGQLLPVKISVAGCDGINRIGLLPDIRLLGGDPTPSTNEADFAVPTTTSVPAADSSGVMRPLSDGYIYNLQVPNDTSVKPGDKYYIRVSPFGIASDQHMIISLQISE